MDKSNANGSRKRKLEGALLEAGGVAYFDRVELANGESCRRGDCVMLADHSIVQILQVWRCAGDEFMEVRALLRRRDLKSAAPCAIDRGIWVGFTSSTIRLCERLYGEMEKTAKPLDIRMSST